MEAFPSIKLTHATPDPRQTDTRHARQTDTRHARSTPDPDARSDASGFVGCHRQRQAHAMPKKSRIRQIRGSDEEGVARGVV